MPRYDLKKYYLGSICCRGHNWNSTGHSLRRLSNSDCLDCQPTTQDKQINWRQLPGNRYRAAIDVRFLTEDGATKKAKVRPVPYSDAMPKDWYEVQFDEEYVVEKLQKEVVKPLKTLGYNRFQQLLSKAWQAEK